MSSTSSATTAVAKTQPVFVRKNYLQQQPPAYTDEKHFADEAKKAGCNFIGYLFSNIMGDMRAMDESLVETSGVFESGLGVDGSSSGGFARVDKSDILLRPSLDTARIFRPDPEEKEDAMANVFCFVDSAVTKAPHPADPRGILQKQIDRCRSHGWEPMFMSEIEFFVLDKNNQPVDRAKYLSIPPFDKLYKYRRDYGDLMIKNGVNVRRVHHECGPAQCEVEINLGPVMKTADDTLRGRWFADMIAHRYGWHSTVEPKPLKGEAGSGLHQHIQLIDKKGNNVFGGSDEKKGLSEIGLQFVAGLLKYSREIISVTARCEDSFERLKPGFEAPIYATWDYMNRSSMVRIPSFSKASKIKIEFRAGDFAGSPHVLMAMILAAGLQGIEEKLTCPAPTEIDCDHLSEEERKKMGITMLPTTLKEANQILGSNQWIHSIIGKDVANFLIAWSEKTSKLKAEMSQGKPEAPRGEGEDDM